jgi:hypothetical protein
MTVEYGKIEHTFTLSNELELHGIATQYGSRHSLADQGDLGVPGEPGAFVVPA